MVHSDKVKMKKLRRLVRDMFTGMIEVGRGHSSPIKREDKK